MKKVKGYKITDPDSTCRGMLFEIGKTYTHEGDIKLCEAGFHFCVQANHCFNYRSFNRDNKVYEIETSGIVEHGTDKSVTNKIKIMRLLSWEEVLKVANSGFENTGHSNTGDRNTGYSNTGDSNTGDRNTGDSNTGDWNTGDRNTGDRNTGDWNTGDRNTGDSNTGDWNTGDSNTGDWNTGDRNTGDSNTGDWNTGYRNTGDWNTGDRNTGDWNTGNWNTGDWNTGDRNTGDWNTGNWNTGDSNTGDRNTGNWNTGDRNTGNCNTGDSNTGDRNTGNCNTGNWNTGNWNTGDCNTGYSNTGDRNTGLFCMKDAPFPIFDKKSNWTEKELLNSRVYSLMCQVDTKFWVDSSVMTEAEKELHPSWETVGGYLKDIPFKEAFQNAWGNWSKENRQEFKDLPNFNATTFEFITGVKI